jgi:16S rRNA (guanine966-N2)-methyltransferase
MSTKKSSVRIIGGEHRSRRLHFTDQGGDLRPSTDRVRETLFNWLQFDLADRRVLDLFAGSGILAAEALSRGAVSAELIEKKPQRAGDLRRELEPIFGARVSICNEDALRWLRRPTGHQFDLVFIDPPYDLGVVSEVCGLLHTQDWLLPNSLVYVETRSHDPLPALPDGWQLQREKLAGEVAARLYRADTLV